MKRIIFLNDIFFTLKTGLFLRNIFSCLHSSTFLEGLGFSGVNKLIALILVGAIFTFSASKAHAAVTQAALTSAASSSGLSTYTTSSITPSANNLVIVTVLSRVTSGAPNQPTLSGNGLTYVAVNSVVNNNRRLTVYRAMGASPSTGVVTMSYAGQTQTFSIWAVSQFAGVDQSGTNGSGAIVQSVTNSNISGNTITGTLATFASTGNATFGAFAHNSNESATPGTGFTEIHDTSGINANGGAGIETEWNSGNDTTVDASWATTNVNNVVVALEVNALRVASATTTGNAGYGTNYLYATGNLTNQTGSTATYGVKYGAGSGYSGTACQSLPTAADVGTIPTGYINDQYNALVSGLSGGTLYYFCLYVRDSGGTYYYSPTTSSLTTSTPSPSVNLYSAHTIDDTSAILPAGILYYGQTGLSYTFFWGTSNVACTSMPNNSGNYTTTLSWTSNYTPVAYRVTGLSPGTKYYYCARGMANSGAQVTYSSVNFFTTATSASTGCSLFPGSSIASSGDSTTVDGYLGTNKLQGTKVYQATVNGWTPANFHSAVDGQGGNIVLIKTTGGKVIGGYDPYSWASGTGTYVPGAGGFLFGLTDGYKLALTNYADYETYSNGGVGFYFGSGDLYDITNPLNTANSAYDSPGSYQTPSSQGAPSTYLNGTNTNNFTPSEIEVYKLSTCTQSAPTVALPTKGTATTTSNVLGGTVTSAGTASIDARGICYSKTSDNANPTAGGVGVTCTPEGQTQVSAFTMTINNLDQNTPYSFVAYAHNSVGYGYTSVNTFTTLSIAPISITTLPYSNLFSYYVTLNGSANPNGNPTVGHFRVFSANPGNCNTDVGGLRFPSLPGDDVTVGNDTNSHNFAFTIPQNSGNFLNPGTAYWYCAFATNTDKDVTAGASNYIPFTTPDGPSSPCDVLMGGSLSIPAGAACNFNGSFNGVDSGTGNSNTATITLGAGAQLTVGVGQSIVTIPHLSGGILTQAEQGSSITNDGIYVHDKDLDGVIDGQTESVGATKSAQAEFIRRNASIVSDYSSKIARGTLKFDCDPSNTNIYQNISNLVKDADHDGYKTSAAAATYCVGASSVINGRTYYKDSLGTYTLMDAGSVLGGGATDCQDDPNGVPCAPINVSASNPSSTSQNNISWSTNSNGGSVPSATSYDLNWCSGASCTPNTTLTNVASTFTHSGLSASTTYGYKVIAKDAIGSSAASSPTQYATTISACTNQTIYSDTDLDGHGSNNTVSYRSITYGTPNFYPFGGTWSYTFNKPAGVVSGEVLVAAISGRYDSVTSVPAGWQVYQSGSNAIYWLVTGASEPASYTFSGTGSFEGNAYLLAYDNVDITSPIDKLSTSTGISPSYPNETIIGLYISVSSDSNAYIIGPPSMTLLQNVPAMGSTAYGFVTMGLYQKTDAPSGFQSYIPSGNEGVGEILLALKPKISTSQVACITGGIAPGGWSLDQTDTNDNNSALFKYITGYADMDGDGVVSATGAPVAAGATLVAGFQSNPGTDCDDTNQNHYQLLTGYSDEDSDGYTVGGATQVCSGASLASGYRASASPQTDCYDKNRAAGPGSAYTNDYMMSDTSAGGPAPYFQNSYPAIDGGGTDRGGNTGNSYDYNCDGSSVMRDYTAGQQVPFTSFSAGPCNVAYSSSEYSQFLVSDICYPNTPGTNACPSQGSYASCGAFVSGTGGAGTVGWSGSTCNGLQVGFMPSGKVLCK